jgi:ankyrin repeat protein
MSKVEKSRARGAKPETKQEAEAAQELAADVFDLARREMIDGRDTSRHLASLSSDVLAMRDGDGLGLVHWAARQNLPKALKCLCKQGQLEAMDDEGLRASHWAARLDAIEALQALESLGARWSERDNTGKTPLMRASMMGNQKAFDWLSDKSDHSALDDLGQSAAAMTYASAYVDRSFQDDTGEVKMSQIVGRFESSVLRGELRVIVKLDEAAGRREAGAAKRL